MTNETTETTDNIPAFANLDELYLAIERARGTVELVAQCVSDGAIEATGYVSAHGLAAVLGAAVTDLDRACETVKGLPRRT